MDSWFLTIVIIMESSAGMSSSSIENEDQQQDGNYQIVPYRGSVLPIFSQEARSFEFADKKWVISQSWEDIGVASVVWESAILLSQYLVELGKSALSGCRVIELGAGTGLVGMVASALGASSVVLTDKDTRPAKVNLLHNKHNLMGKNITVSELEWGSSVLTFDPPYDIILAADVIYIEETFPDLIKTLKELSNSESVILLSCKRRYKRHDQFFEQLLSDGTFVDEVVRIWPEREEVKVHKLSRPVYQTTTTL